MAIGETYTLTTSLHGTVTYTDYGAPTFMTSPTTAQPSAPSYSAPSYSAPALAPPPPPDTPSIVIENPNEISASVRGQHIPVGRGTRRVGGRPIDRIRYSNPNSDGSWPALVAYSFGGPLDFDVQQSLVELVANGNQTIWSVSDGAASGVTVTFYNGQQTTADPQLVAYHGADLTPAYKDHIYAVIKFDSLVPYNNQEPRVSARLKDTAYSGETIPVADVVTSVCERCGLSTSISDLGHVLTAGFTSDDMMHGVHITGEVHPLDFLKNAGRVWQFDYYESGKAVVVRKIAIPVTAPTIADVPVNHRMAVSDDGSTVTTKAASRHVSKVVEVSYQDTSIDEQVSVQRARTEATDSADIERWSVPFVMTASRALTQASIALQQAEAEGDEHQHELTPLYTKYEPCDTAQFSVEGKTYTAKLWTVTLNQDFSVKFEYRNVTETRSAWTSETVDPEPNVDTPDPEDTSNNLRPATGALTLTGNQPTVAIVVDPIQPSTGALTLTGNTPTLADPAVPVTWNSADKSPFITLSAGDLRATNNRTSFNGVHYAVRATAGKSSGKWIFRARVVDYTSTTGVSVGLANSSHDLATYIGAGANSVGYRASGVVHLNGSNLGSFEEVQLLEYVDIAVDFGNSKLWVRVVGGTNNWNDGAGEDPATNSGGVSIASLTGTLYPACSLWIGNHDGGPDICDFVQSIPAGEVPSGFTVWAG